MSTLQTAPHQDWLDLPLVAGGRSVIEASAGTGKTWTIGMLYLRCVVDEGLLPRQILVSTFTRAAAAEISARVREVLELALAHCRGTASPHPGIRRWFESKGDTPAIRQQAESRLSLALAGFDQAAIVTLHSLCQRIVSDHPFAVRAGFTAPTLVDSADLDDEIARDLWRRIAMAEDDSPLRLAWQREESARIAMSESTSERGFEAFRKAFSAMFKDGLTLESVPPAPVPEGLATQAKAWDVARIAQFLGQAALRKDRKGSKSASAMAEAYLRAGGDLDRFPSCYGDAVRLEEPILCTKESRVSADELAAFVDFIRALGEWSRARDLHVRLEFWRTLLSDAAALRDRKLPETNQLTFDAVLSHVRDALREERVDTAAGRPLADALFAAWPVAMIDEFQDTDGIQFEILDRIYRDDSDRLRGRLVMIGDPKQSIYRFRGADVSAYVRAAAPAPDVQHLELAMNFRSTPAYLTALNHLYAISDLELGAPGQNIQYSPVAPGDKPLPEFKIQGASPAPLRIWRSDTPSDSDALRACAAQIAELLADSGATLGGKPLQPGDIAVLLPRHKDIQALINHLRALGVPAVSRNAASVFESETARELHILLHAIAHPRDPRARRAAAATGLIGADFQGVVAWSKNAALEQALADQIAAWNALWSESGPLHLVSQLQTTIAPRYLKTLKGERVMTDLRHLGECLQAFAEHGAPPLVQLDWFARQCQGEAEADEDARDALAMRMESDERRVQVMTLHGSKGLEFPLVFLPLAWRPTRDASAPYVYTDASGERRVSPLPHHKDACSQELEHEARRLLYVALTRGVHGTWLYAANEYTAANNRKYPPSPYLTHLAGEALFSESARAAGIEVFDAWPATRTAARFQEARDLDVQVARIAPPALAGALPGRHSFSTLTRGARHLSAVESRPGDGDRDADAEDLATPQASPIFELNGVKGAGIGNALHEMMEFRDFGLPMVAQLPLVNRYLRSNGLARGEEALASLAQKSAEMLDRAMTADLRVSPEVPFTLGMLKPADTRAEMAFDFEISTFRMGQLRALLEQHDLRDILPDRNFEVRGMLNGKIDLVFAAQGRFHVLDYKGNHLGRLDADYSGDALLQHMDESHYRFQALIYVVALDRYLASRMTGYRRDQHLGQAIYVFLRAAREDSVAGVWSHRFDDALIDGVQALLGGRAHEVAA